MDLNLHSSCFPSPCLLLIGLCCLPDDHIHCSFWPEFPLLCACLFSHGETPELLFFFGALTEPYILLEVVLTKGNWVQDPSPAFQEHPLPSRLLRICFFNREMMCIELSFLYINELDRLTPIQIHSLQPCSSLFLTSVTSPPTHLYDSSPQNNLAWFFWVGDGVVLN